MNARNILREGVIVTALMSLSLAAAGYTHTLARAQDGNIQAANNSNNKVTKKKTYVIVQPDLTIESVQVDSNDDRKLRIQIINKGNANAKACNMKVFYHRSGEVMVRGTGVSPILAGETLWVLMDVGSPIPAASKVILRVDAPNRVRESNEANNSYTYK